MAGLVPNEAERAAALQHLGAAARRLPGIRNYGHLNAGQRAEFERGWSELLATDAAPAGTESGRRSEQLPPYRGAA